MPCLGNTSNSYVTTVGAGSIAINDVCHTSNPINGAFCLWGIPSGSGQVVVDVLPPGGIAASFGTTQISWDYRDIFNSLVLGP
jgi:hypothetical protein